MNKNGKIILFFVIAVLLYITSVRLAQSTKCDHLTLIGIGSAYVLAIHLLYQAIKPNSDDVEGYENPKNNDSAFGISDGAMCKGTPYLYSGDGEFSKMCQSVDKCELAKYNCPTGFDGSPATAFEYSSHSDSLWNDIPCVGSEPLPVQQLPKQCGNGCSM
jgi:hypothetical protein